jgi:hypothetical protein
MVYSVFQQTRDDHDLKQAVPLQELVIPEIS